MIELSAIAQMRYHKITASATPFGTPDGSTTAFQLVDSRGRPITRIAVTTAMHRTDWQGRQLLYTTPRTNLCIHSQDITGWVGSRMTTANNATAGPDGGTVVAVLETAVLGGHHVTANMFNPVVGSIHTLTVDVIPNGRTFISIQLNVSTPFPNLVTVRASLAGSGSLSSIGSGVTAATIQLLASGYYRITLTTGAATSTTSTGVDVSTYVDATYTASFTGDVTKGINLRADVKSDVASAYIPTVASSVTVTDYSNTTSGAVTLGQAPIVGATLDWDGTGVSVG